MTPSGHISLVGLSGTGKSTVAPLLAGLLDRESLDLDDQVADAAGSPVHELFASEGETRFRQRELVALGVALDGAPIVLSTGGGVVTTPEAARLLSERSTVVWLRATPQVLAARIESHGQSRPLLEGDVQARLEAMADQRGPLYAAIADHTVDVDELDATEVATAVARVLGAPA